MVKSESIVSSFKDEIKKLPGGERLLNCYLCGTCTAGCPISEIKKEFNPRKIMRQILLGMKEEVLSSKEIWLCIQCHVCVAHCPQDARFADIIRVIREMAIKEGYAKADILEKIEKIDRDMLEARKNSVEELTK